MFIEHFNFSCLRMVCFSLSRCFFSSFYNISKNNFTDKKFLILHCGTDRGNKLKNDIVQYFFNSREFNLIIHVNCTAANNKQTGGIHPVVNMIAILDDVTQLSAMIRFPYWNARSKIIIIWKRLDNGGD